MVVLKRCKPEIPFILAELFTKCLKESCFPECWMVSSVVPVFKNVVDMSTTKNYLPVSPSQWLAKYLKNLLQVVSCFFFLYGLPSLSLSTVFDSILSYLDEVLFINPSANVFVFEGFNIHPKNLANLFLWN